MRLPHCWCWQSLFSSDPARTRWWGPSLRTEQPGISLSPTALPVYALRTTMRMLAALVASLIFTFIYATPRGQESAGRNSSDTAAGRPPIGAGAGLSLLHGRVLRLAFSRHWLGPELAAIFAIFTAQAWNMAFSFYQSLITDSDRSRRGEPQFPVLGLATLLAPRGAVRDAGAGLEHDDVDVGRLVLCRRFRSYLRRQHPDRASGNRLVRRPRNPAA